MAKVPTIFISYARESLDHMDKVLAFADRMETLGVEVVFDQYEPNPKVPWPKWMELAMLKSDFIISICTKTYYDRVTEQQAPGTGLGAQWEGTLIYNQLASESEFRNKFQVVQFDAEDRSCIPGGLLGNNRYMVKQFELEDPQFEELYRLITEQPKATRPERGSLVSLPSRSRAVIPRSGEEITDTSDVFLPELRSIDKESRAKPLRQFRPKAAGKGTYIERLARGALEAASKGLRLHDLPGALANAQRAHRLNPNNPVTLTAMADCLYALGRYEEAIPFFESHLSRVDQDFERSLERLICLAKVGKESDAMGKGRELFETQVRTSESTLEFASFCSELGEHDLAIAEVEAFDSEGKIKRLTSMKAVYHWFAGRNDVAVEILEALPKEELHPIEWTNLGVGRAEAGRFGLAIEAIKEGVIRGGHTAFSDYALAQIYALMGDAETAVSKLTSLRETAADYFQRAKIERTFNSIRSTDLFQQKVMNEF